ncbi:MAG: hypothetical protein SGILL_002088 [Bacillariaceae sp.]
MECREPLFWNPPKPPPALQHHNQGAHRSPAHPRYQRGRMSAARYSPNPTPQTPPHPSMPGVGQEKKEEPLPLPLPKNVVLMEMIEAKERQQRLLQEARLQEHEALMKKQEEKLQQLQDQLEGDHQHGHLGETNMNLMDDDEADDEDDDDEDEVLLDPALAGMAAFTGYCGTYVVREPLGLVVLPQDPNRKHQQPSSTVSPGTSPAPSQAASSFDFEPTKDSMLGAPPPKPQQIPLDDDQDEKKEPALGEDDNDLRYSSSKREPFSLEVGQKVQVVGVEEGVYQLARGTGYIVATVNQLVKVGGPLEMSCKLEGMLQSVGRKQGEVQKQLDEINRLARGLREKIVIEQSHPEEHPVITLPKSMQNVDGHLINSIHQEHEHLPTVPDDSQPSTPTKYRTGQHGSPHTGDSAGDRSDTSTQVELGAPRTPGPPQSSAGGPFLEMEHGSGSQSYDHPYVYSPAHSCPMPSVNAAALNQPFIDGTPTGLPRYRVNNDDDMYGLGWAGTLGCGTSLFGERLLEPSRNGSPSIMNASGNDILALSFDEHSLLDNASARSRAAALAASAGVTAGSQDSPLRSGGSFDGVNFRTGMSGHVGLSQPKRNRNGHHTGLIHASSATLPRRQVRMMSEHRGVAHARGNPNAPGAAPLKRRTTPDAIVGPHDY